LFDDDDEDEALDDVLLRGQDGHTYTQAEVERRLLMSAMSKHLTSIIRSAAYHYLDTPSSACPLDFLSAKSVLFCI
jgi:hypothetical protein